MATDEKQLWELSTRSEAIYLDAVSDDGASGFIARLCRFPEYQMAWLWLHVFHHGHVHSFTHHEIPCGMEPVDESAGEVVYEAGDFRFIRTGDRFSPGEVTVSASALLHSGPDSPHGNGTLPCELRAMFTPALAGVASREGRSEVLGVTRGAIVLGDVRIELEARGQFHEQIQQDPRFNRPFSYATLRGPDAGCIFIRGVRGAVGSLILNNQPHAIQAVRLDPPGTIRRMEILIDGAEPVRGEAVATYQYDIPIFHMTRPGSLVTAELAGHRLCGCINDLVFGDLVFDHLQK